MTAFKYLTTQQFQALPRVAQRFLRYVTIDTQSDPRSSTTPSTDKQKNLGRLLVQELHKIGITDAMMDGYGYVFGTIPATNPSTSQVVVALLAHMDTSPDEPGDDVEPVIHANYNGDPVVFPADPALSLTPEQQPALLNHLGEDLITSDGTTLLGSDDKAGVAVLMQLAEDLFADPTLIHPTIRLCFTIDEEIGRGVESLNLDTLGADVAYTLDGSSIDNISFETFNAAAATIEIEGTMVHPGYAKGIMVNALRIAAEFISLLPSDEAPETTSGYEGYLHPHSITQSNAARASIELIIRDFTDEGLLEKKQLIKNIAKGLQQKYPASMISCTINDQYKNMRSYIEATDPRTISFSHEAAHQMGLTLKEHVVRGGTDGARLSEKGIPTPNVFNGGYDYHSRFEWNTVQNLKRSLAFTKKLMACWASAHRLFKTE